MEIKLNLKMEWKVFVLIVIICLLVLFILYGGYQEPIIMVYTNCTCPTSDLGYWDYEVESNDVSEQEPPFLGTLRCCYPSECGIPCEYENNSNCIYPVMCGTLKELGLED